MPSYLKDEVEDLDDLVAVQPLFDGLSLDGVFTLYELDEAAASERYVSEASPDSAAIVGGGYVGVELAEALSARGVDVALYEMVPHVLQPFGDAVAEVVASHLREQRVDLHLDTPVSGFEGTDRVERVALEADARPADTQRAGVAIVGVGVAPNTDMAAEAGTELGETGPIATDDYGRTIYENVYGRTICENVYAAGDCADAPRRDWRASARPAGVDGEPRWPRDGSRSGRRTPARTWRWRRRSTRSRRSASTASRTGSWTSPDG